MTAASRDVVLSQPAIPFASQQLEAAGQSCKANWTSKTNSTPTPSGWLQFRLVELDSSTLVAGIVSKGSCNSWHRREKCGSRHMAARYRKKSRPMIHTLRTASAWLLHTVGIDRDPSHTHLSSITEALCTVLQYLASRDDEVSHRIDEPRVTHQDKIYRHIQSLTPHIPKPSFGSF